LHFQTIVMKKILLLSDTHSYLDEKVLKYVRQADEVWHAGDIGDLTVTDTLKSIKPLRGVYGNIDDDKARMEFPLNNRFFCEGVDVLITHIGGYPGKYNQAIREEITLNPPKLFICGHSHILKVQFDKKLNLLHMNPGACGIHGFHQVRTMLRFEIDGDKIQNLEIVELGNRGS
jgi:putative phosphoesterase